MRRRALALALAASTTLTPAPAQAVAVGGFLTTLSAGIGSSFAAGGFFTTAVGRIVLGLGLNLLATALMPRPQGPRPSDRMVNFAAPVAYAEWAFGMTRKGGPLGFTAFAKDRRYYVPILAAHSIDGVETHYLDENRAGVDAAVTDVEVANILTSADDDDAYDVDPVVSQYGRIDVFTGQAGQVAHPGLVSTFADWTAAHDFKGVSGAVIWAARSEQERFQVVYPGGREWAYTPVIRGNDTIYDPRDDTEKYTANAALCLAWWIVNVLGQAVDWDEVAVEADASDVTVTNGDGGTQARWEINGTISDDMDFEAQRAALGIACDAFIYERPDGKVGFKVGRWIAPTITLTEADCFSCQVASGPGEPGASTEVAGSYIEPANAWRETPSGAWVQVPGEKRTRSEPALDLVASHNQAYRINKRLARLARPAHRVSLSVGLIGYQMIGQRFFRLNTAAVGIDAVFEVQSIRRVSAWQFEIEAVSVVEDDFANDPGEEPARPAIARIRDSATVSEPENITVTPQDGALLRVAWDVPTDDQDKALVPRVRYRPTGGDYAYWTGADVTETATTLAVAPGAHEVQVSLSRAGGARVWYPDPAIEATAETTITAPTSHTAFSGSESGGTVTLSYTAPDQPIYAATRVYRGVTSDPFAATLRATILGIGGESRTYEESPGAGTWYYWVVPTNGSLIHGPFSGPESFTI